MPELRANCEYCDKDLPAASMEAYICTYEYTFCVTCVKQILENVCPNCGGGFTLRPIRPRTEHRLGISLVHQPASVERIHTKYSQEDIVKFSDTVNNINSRER